MNTREIRHRDVIHALGNQAKRLKDALALSAMVAEEYGDLWDLHDQDDVAVACQLYGVDSPTEEQIAAVADLHRGIELLARYGAPVEEDRVTMRRLA